MCNAFANWKLRKYAFVYVIVICIHARWQAWKKILKILLKAILNITLGTGGSESISILCPSVTSSAPSSSWAQTLCSPSGVLRLISLSCGWRERLYSKTQGRATLFPVVVWFGLVGWLGIFVCICSFVLSRRYNNTLCSATMKFRYILSSSVQYPWHQWIFLLENFLSFFGFCCCYLFVLLSMISWYPTPHF